MAKISTERNMNVVTLTGKMTQMRESGGWKCPKPKFKQSKRRLLIQDVSGKELEKIDERNILSFRRQQKIKSQTSED